MNTARLVSGALVVGLLGCHSVQELGYPAHYIRSNGPMRVWVTEANDSVLLVNGPTMSGDTLRGFVGGRYRELPPDQVKAVKAIVPNHTRTAIVASVAALGVGGLLIAVTDAHKVGTTTCYDEHNDVVPC